MLAHKYCGIGALKLKKKVIWALQIGMHFFELTDCWSHTFVFSDNSGQFASYT